MKDALPACRLEIQALVAPGRSLADRRDGSSNGSWIVATSRRDHPSPARSRNAGRGSRGDQTAVRVKSRTCSGGRDASRCGSRSTRRSPTRRSTRMWSVTQTCGRARPRRAGVRVRTTVSVPASGNPSTAREPRARSGFGEDSGSAATCPLSRTLDGARSRQPAATRRQPDASRDLASHSTAGTRTESRRSECRPNGGVDRQSRCLRAEPTR